MRQQDLDVPSLGDVQCRNFNNWVFPGVEKVHQWTAYKEPDGQLARFVYFPKEMIDLQIQGLKNIPVQPKLKWWRLFDREVSTEPPATGEIRDICMEGICREIPSDLNMESNDVEDACGVCKGSGTSCSLKEGKINIAVASG